MTEQEKIQTMLYLLYKRRLNAYEIYYRKDLELVKVKFETIKGEKPFISVQQKQTGEKVFVRLWMTEPTEKAISDGHYAICEALVTLEEVTNFIKENNLVEQTILNSNKIYN